LPAVIPAIWAPECRIIGAFSEEPEPPSLLLGILGRGFRALGFVDDGQDSVFRGILLFAETGEFALLGSDEPLIEDSFLSVVI
jgi:hypothetical protein